MQKIILIILSLLSLQNALNAQTFELKVDTLNLDLKEIARSATKVDLTHAVKYNEKYFCFFLEKGLYSFKRETKYFLIISKDGTILKNIKVPQEIQNTDHFDFFIRNDSLLTKTEMEQKSFYFDIKTLEWVKIMDVDDRVYEDTNFAVTYLDFGEWGETTWFIDKQTQKEYVLGARGTTVNLSDGKYYLTNSAEIIEIENPRNLKQCDKDCYYKIVEKRQKFYEGSTSLIGSKKIYKDTIFSLLSFEEPVQTIITSFTSNNRLYQIYSDRNSTYFGLIENEKLIPIQNIFKKYSVFNYHYSYRGNNLSNNSRFLKFREDNNTFGFIEINDTNIEIHYLRHNIDSLKYLCTDGFEKILNIVKVNTNNLSFEQVERIENELGGVDMKTNRNGISHNGYYPKAYSSIQVKTKEFIKVEDEIIAQTTEYLYTEKDERIKSIFIEWSLTEQYNNTNTFNFKKVEKPEVIDRFKGKQNEIVETITNKLGIKPNKTKRGSGYIKLTWVLKSGLQIVMYGSDKRKGKEPITVIINLP